MQALTFAVVALWAVVLLLVAAIFALARQVGVLLERVQPVGAMIADKGPEIGTQVPALALPNLNGPGLVLGRAGGRSQLVFFLSTSCPICKALVPALRSAARAEGDWLDVVLASDGKPEPHREMIRRERLQDFPYTLSAELGMTFKVAKLPFAILIDGAGRVRAKGLVNTREQLESLFHAAELGRPSIQSLAADPPGLPA
ncbi:redoxin domain-containing protein [Rubellimicrobium aerolatum]|uniref:Redoxin domain-containing protein n=1 Tax=Rubellimicrobium aerolatum TaxID=490979 RepID=A0ABW0SAJ8_9RHOB|nr:redoxin domain-containing protein [Rubellimicrobium aerolatum]MBP1805254.1 methylamine dehydrogenase accessory protein MauD [Rubellimicrobium aerolatum]